MKRTTIVLMLNAAFAATAAAQSTAPANQNIPGCGLNNPEGQSGQYGGGQWSGGTCFAPTSGTHLSIYGIADVGVGHATVADANTSSPHANPLAATGATHGKVNDTFVNSGQSAGSRLGFAGTGQIQDGLSAVFVLEQRVEFDTGGNTNPSFDAPPINNVTVSTPSGTTTLTSGIRSWDRQIYAGLVSSQYGAFTIGRQYTPRADLTSATDLISGGYTQSTNNIGFPMSTNRMSNSLKWVSPLWGGFTGRIQYSPGGSTLSPANAVTQEPTPNTTGNTATSLANTVNKDGDKAYSLGLSYERPNLVVGYSLLQSYSNTGSGSPSLVAGQVNGSAAAPIYINNVAVAGLQGYGAGGAVTALNPAYRSATRFEQWNSVFALYDFGVAKVSLNYTAVKNNISKNFATGTYSGATTATVGASNAIQARGDRSLLALGVQVPFGRQRVYFGYSKFDDKSQLKQNASQEAAIYEYTFGDKKTTLYAFGALLQDKNSATWGFGSAGSAASTLSTIGGESGAYYGAGMKYVF